MKSIGYIRRNHPFMVKMLMIWRVITKKELMLISINRGMFESGQRSITPQITTRTNLNCKEEAQVLSFVANKLVETFENKQDQKTNE